MNRMRHGNAFANPRFTRVRASISVRSGSGVISGVVTIRLDLDIPSVTSYPAFDFSMGGDRERPSMEGGGPFPRGRGIGAARTDRGIGIATILGTVSYCGAQRELPVSRRSRMHYAWEIAGRVPCLHLPRAWFDHHRRCRARHGAEDFDHLSRRLVWREIRSGAAIRRLARP